MTHCTEMYVPKRINCTTFDDPLNFYLAPSSLISTYLDLHVQRLVKCQLANLSMLTC